jgi:predicted dehydrogenase
LKINIAVVGLGYWGPNLVRALTSVSDVNLSALCDLEVDRAATVAKRYCQGARIVTDYRDVMNDREIDAVVLATPIRSHFELASAFLTAGKHMFVEKPLAQTVEECRTLIDVAQRHRRVLMVDHVFQYSEAVQRIKRYLDQGELGRLLYMYSQRVNLGRIQRDVGALWSFAPHDVSIMNYWLNGEPEWVTTRGFSYLSRGVEDVVFVTMGYPGGIGAHLHLGWLDPRKVRSMTLVGSKKMLVYDDVSVDAKIRLYDKGIVQLHDYLEVPESFADFRLQIRAGDVLIPTLQSPEPLQTACQHFIDCVRTGQRPRTDGEVGLGVVRVLEAAEQSLRQGGFRVELRAGVGATER